MAIAYRILGPLEVARDGEPLPLGGGRQRTLLADLLIHRNQVVSIDRLIDDLWGEDPPETAANVLQVHISGLRKALGDGANQPLITRKPGYLLRVGAEELDADRFESLVAQGKASLERDPAMAAAILSEALALFVGPPLAEVAFEGFAQAEIDKLEELRASAREERIEAELALGRHTGVIGDLQGLVGAQPLRERPRGQLMLALYRSGRQAEALEVYRGFREHLAEELGIDPSRDLQRLEGQILNQDAALNASERTLVPQSRTSEPPEPRTRVESLPRTPAPPPATQVSRRVVTVLFCDVAGSTALAERIDPEVMRTIMARYFARMREVLERHGATVEKFIGDAVMAVFGIPAVHEDDALRAVRAASELRMALLELGVELRAGHGVALDVRTGINTGEVVAGDPATGETLVTGDAVNVAARLEQAAEPGEILLGPITYRMVRDSVAATATEPLALKGKSAPVEAYRLSEVLEGVAPRRRFDIPFVGRARELRLLVDAYERAIADQACQLVTVLGVAGVGKSRLVAEALLANPEGTVVLTGRCLPYGDGITFWPIGEIVRAAAGITEAEDLEEARAKIDALSEGEDRAAEIAQGVSQLIGLAEPTASLEESFWATRELLEALARHAALVVVIDDLHWAEPALLDLVEHVTDWSREAPIMLICLARPEFLETRPGWAGGKLNATSFALEPLDAAGSDALVAGLLDGHELSAGFRARLREASGGNPLFVEETVGELIDTGGLVREGSAWVEGDGAEVRIPPTISALLAARLDRLRGEERTVIEGASVVGQEFYRGAVAELAPEALRPDVGTYLRSLVRKDLVRTDRARFSGEETYRFRHILIRDAAYAAMPKGVRAELHERFARWLERIAGERLPEYEEIVGYHLERAFGYRAELGQIDDETRQVCEAAALSLGRAGVRAAKRADYPAAESLLSRAINLRPLGREAVEWQVRRARAQHNMGNTALAKTMLEDALAKAEAGRDPGATWRARVAHKRFLLFVDPDWPPAEARALADEAIPALDALSDDWGLALAYRLLGDAESYLGRFERWGEACMRAMEHAERAGDLELRGAVASDLMQALVYGPTPVQEALDRCRGLSEDNELSQSARLWTTAIIALLQAMVGNLDDSARLMALADAGYAELGLFRDESLQEELAGQIDLMAGDPASALKRFQSELGRLRESGDTGLGSWVMGLLCVATYQLGKFEEAEQWCRESERLGGSDLFSQLKWRSVLAMIQARRGEFVEAERVARETVEVAETTDLLQLRAELQLGLAEVLRFAGRHDESRRHIRQAIELYERKGITLLASKGRDTLDRTDVPSSP